MNGKDLLKSMTAIDEELIKEAENYTVHKSERGGITMKQQNQNFQEFSEPEQNTGKVSMYRNALTAAACLLLCAGLIGGGIHSLQQRKNLAEMPSAEVTETETIQTETKANQPANVVSETQAETKKNDKPVKETQKAAEFSQTTATPETKTSASQKMQETAVQPVTSNTVTVQEETVPAEEIPETFITVQEIQQEIAQEVPETVAHEQETEVIPDAHEQETEVIPETEPVQEFAEIQLEAAPLDDRGLPVIPGYTLKYLWPSEVNFDITPEGFPENSSELRTFPRFPTKETRFDLNYTSGNLICDGENVGCPATDDGVVSFGKRFYSEDESIKIYMCMTIMTSDTNFILEGSDNHELPYDNLTFYPVSVNGNYGYFKTNGNGNIVNMTWYQDGYCFFIFENYEGENPYETGIPFWYAGELLKMAESVQISE